MDGPHTWLEGLGQAFIFFSVLEVDHSEKFILHESCIIPYESTSLFPINHSNWYIDPDICFLNQKIADIRIGEDSLLYILLENYVAISHREQYGSKLFVRRFSEVYGAN